MKERSERIATRAIILSDNKVLLGKRGRGICANEYALIGGKPDEGETPEQAIVREVKEETGLNLINPVLWKEESNDRTIPGQVWHTYCFIGETEGTLKLKEDEISEIKYVGRGDLESVAIAFNHKEIIAEYFEKYLRLK
ncbi:hypothetical protein A2Z67_02035 [Candidatus Woesebacteria bacterium RBG_13_36_22]|uniref:Nudix hydrolase domain-containing protein n=1 Tax=Candidatus Woesebacteria bacterium RBG_13_36_22 TaxID=1802478 RepID=A0A1F7X4Q1_9BACT|nr:MAG: hypothetical protein A2Z67_02035 [Candidatus Woesebacteria bacterium RBG_13_36_22]